MKKHEKIRRKRITRDFTCYHEPLITASRYVMRDADGMFQAMHIDIKEYWVLGGATVRVYVIKNRKRYRSKVRWLSKKAFDNVCKRDISPELYCQAVLSAEVFNLYAKTVSEEDVNMTL